MNLKKRMLIYECRDAIVCVLRNRSFAVYMRSQTEFWNEIKSGAEL